MKSKAQIILLAVSTLLIVMNFYLLHQNLALRAAIASTQNSTPQEGDVLNDLEGTNLDDVEMRITFQDNSHKRVLFFFRTNCKFCHKQMNLWKSLKMQVDSSKFQFIAVTAEKESAGVREFLGVYDVDDWDVIKIRPEDALKARFGVTPITTIVDQSGRIEKLWTGLWTTDQIQTINRYFDVSVTDF